MTNKVWNKYDPNTPADAVYIGRGSPWGNPFKVGSDLYTRDGAISMFNKYAREKLKKEPNWLLPLIGKDLVCFCKPRACHGDVILELLKELYG